MITYLAHLAVIICIYATVAVALDFSFGISGLPNFAQAAFWGIGAYAAAAVAQVAESPFPITLLIGSLASGVIGVVVGVACRGLSEDRFALVTLAFGIMFLDLLRISGAVLGGTRGLSGIPPVEIGGIALVTPVMFLPLAVALALGASVALRALVDSNVGRVLRAIRDDALAAETLGIRVGAYKIFATCISAGVAGLSGALYAHYAGVLVPSRFAVGVSFDFVAMVVIGGVASLVGGWLGASVFVLLPEILRMILPLSQLQVAAMREAVYAIILFCVILYRPQGVFGGSSHPLRPRA